MDFTLFGMTIAASRSAHLGGTVTMIGFGLLSRAFRSRKSF
jgi:hypothetical protein